MYLWWSLYTLYLHACQERVTAGDSGLCCCTCVTYFERQLTPLCIDSARALWASFCFQIDDKWKLSAYSVWIIVRINENCLLIQFQLLANALLNNSFQCLTPLWPSNKVKVTESGTKGYSSRSLITTVQSSTLITFTVLKNKNKKSC